MESPIAGYLPQFPSAESITIGHLLGHSSGIAHTNDLPWGSGDVALTLDEIIARLAALPLDFEPGTHRSYSNGGYAVAAKILEVVDGSSFSGAMRATVFEPLGMRDTDHLADSLQVVPGMATGYEPGWYPGERRHARFYAVETRPGGGSFYSTARDLLKFARGVFRGRFLDETALIEVLGVDEEGFLTQGRSPGFVAKLLYDRALDLIVISLANNYAVPADWARTIADLATGKGQAAPWQAIRRAADVVDAGDPRLGRYRSSRGGGAVAIERDALGAMVLSDPANRSRTGLVPLTDGDFLQPLYFQRCSQDSDSRAITCRILSGDPRYTTELTPIAPE